MLFVTTYRYVSDYTYVTDVIYGDDFKLMLKRYLNGTDFRRDWIGRLYGVVNPTLDVNGKYNINNQIFELDGDNTNNNEYVKQWFYKQMMLVSDLFDIHKTGLFDILGTEIKHVGPKSHDNYLIIFDIVNRRETVHWLKKTLKHFGVYLVLLLILLVIIL